MFDGSRLRQARLEAGLTQDQLAWKARCSQRNIVRWERGHNQPRPVTVVRLAEATGRPVEFFHTDEPGSTVDIEADSMSALRLLVDRAVRERSAA